jgi:hypothetical protein
LIANGVVRQITYNEQSACTYVVGRFTNHV